jgi:nucleotide-binding universal stress UspA family protein
MSELTHKVVAGIAEIAADDPILLTATEVARVAGAELHLVHAYELPTLFTMSPGVSAAFPEGLKDYEAALLQKLEDAARKLPGGEEAVCHVVPGKPVRVLARIAAEVEADLLVVGAARRARLGRAILGTTAQRVLRASPVPVLVARRPVTGAPERVLLTTDLTEMSAAVHESALYTVGEYFGAPAHLRSLLVLAWSAIPPPLPADALEHTARGELEKFLGERTDGEKIESVVRTGFAADEIVAEAREWNADLLVLGTHARGWGARLMLGSVAEAALREAPCNVLAVPPRRTAALATAAASEHPWAESPELANWFEPAT